MLRPSNKLFSNRLKFCTSILKATFPFHVIFDNNLCIVQCGNAIARAITQLNQPNMKLTDVFNISRPYINFDFNSINSQIMSIFVLSTKPGLLDIKNDYNNDKQICTRFKGQMIEIDKNLMLFLCSPTIKSIDDLYK